jgi:hypothetical protein
MENKGTKRITKNDGYNRPEKTYQETLSNQDIKEKLKEYKKVNDIKTVSIGTHIRYFNIDPKTKEKIFRLGGILNKVDPEGKYVILSNGTIRWSVQISNAIFFQKMSEVEFKEELKKELKKEIMSEVQSPNEDIELLKKEIKNLKTKIEQYKENEKKYKKENETLNAKIITIENEIKKNKNKK